MGKLVPALVAGLVITAAAMASSSSLTPIPWDASKQGPPFLVVGQQSVWVEALTQSGTSVWRIDPKRATVHPTPITRMVRDVFPGAGALWVSTPPLDDGIGILVDWVDVRHGYRLVRKAVPKSCEEGDGGHSAVYDRRLWFTCARFGVYVYTPNRRTPIEHSRDRNVQALLPAAHGLWLANRTEVRAIAGRDQGAAIALPRGFAVAGDYASNVGWAVSGATVWAIGIERGHPVLVRVDLARRISKVFPIVVPGRKQWLGGGIAVAWNELWFGDEPRARLIRYSLSHPDRPLGYVGLPGHGIAKDGYFRVQSGAGAVWVEVQRPDGMHLFRIAR